MGDFAFETESNSFKQELRRACKNILYMWTNAAYENALGVESSQYLAVDMIIRPVETKQVSLVTWIQIGWDVFAAVTIFLWIKEIIKRRSKQSS